MPRKHEQMTPAVRRALEGKKPTRAELEKQLSEARSIISDLREENRQLRAFQAERQLETRAALALSRRQYRI